MSHPQCKIRFAAHFNSLVMHYFKHYSWVPFYYFLRMSILKINVNILLIQPSYDKPTPSCLNSFERPEKDWWVDVLIQLVPALKVTGIRNQ